MKRLLALTYSTALSLTCVISLFFLQLSPSHADIIKVFSDKWYPMIGEPGSDKPGYMIEIAQAIIEKTEHDLEFNLAPWKRSILEVRQGRADCIIGAFKSDAPDFIFPTQPWGMSQVNFYVPRSSSWKFENLSQLSSSHLGIITGYSYGLKLDQYIQRYKDTDKVQVTSGADPLMQNIKKLLLGRVDVILADEFTMADKLQSLSLIEDVKVASSIAPKEELFIGCSPQKNSSSIYANLFSQGIISLRENGELAKILSRYGLKDWQD